MKPRLRVPAEGFGAGSFRLPDEAQRYVFRVHRLGVGDTLLLFDPETRTEAEARIVADRQLWVEPPRPSQLASMPVHLLQAVGKSDKPEQAIRDATVLGAERVTLVLSARAVARSSSEGRRERFRRVALEAARQSHRGDLPELSGPLEWGEALAAARGELRLVCAPGDDSPPLRRLLVEACTRLARPPSIDLLIGPEGGFSSRELDQARAAGFEAVGLGPLILRTETAATAVLGFLRLFLDE